MFLRRLLPLMMITPLSIFAQDFEIYVSDVGQGQNPEYQILKYDQNGENGQVFIDHHLAWPQDIIFLEDQNLILISNLNSGTIDKFDIESGEYKGIFASGLGGPTRMKLRNGLLYVLQWTGDGKVLAFDLNGNKQSPLTNSGVPLSIGLDWDSAGNIYVSSYGRPARNGQPAIPPTIQKFDPDGSNKMVFVGQRHLAGPTNIWFNPKDEKELLVSDYNGGSVKLFDENGVYKGELFSGLRLSEGYAYTPDGKLLIGNGGTGAIKMYDEEGNFIQDLVKSGSAGLIRPNAVKLRSVNLSSTDRIDNSLNIEISPNIGRMFKIEKHPSLSITHMIIVDTSGAMVPVRSNDFHEINASNWPKGVYQISLTVEDGRTKIISVVVE